MLRFGSFTLDVVSRRLCREAVPIHLTPKAFDLLSLLVSQAPRVVTKRELHGRLWPRRAVTDATLAGVVKEIRRALLDGTQTSPLIRTVHRVGYAFDAAIELIAGNGAGWLLVGEQRLALVDGENFVGRDPAAQVWLDHGSVARHHARIIVAPSGALLEDLGSADGTQVAERRLVGRTELRDGDRVRFGQVRAIYLASPAAQGGALDKPVRMAMSALPSEEGRAPSRAA